MTTDGYERISEVYREDIEEFVPPAADWEIEVVEWGLDEGLGDIGGREPFIANARVRVTEADGSTWEGLTHLD